MRAAVHGLHEIKYLMPHNLSRYGFRPHSNVQLQHVYSTTPFPAGVLRHVQPGCAQQEVETGIRSKGSGPPIYMKCNI
jgi:hypothetical protein